MGIEVSTVNGRVPVTIMHVSGDLDSYSYVDFQAKADELIQSGTHYILVDLSNSAYVSSAGFRVLHYMFNQLRAKKIGRAHV